MDLLFRRQGEDQRHHRAGAGRDDHAGEQQARLRPAAVAARQPEHQHHGRERADKGEARYANAGQAEQHGGECANAGTAGNAEDVRIGERIPEQHLHQRASQCQQPAAAEGGQGARQAQIENDGACGGIRPAEGGHDIGDRQGEATRRKRRDQARH